MGDDGVGIHVARRLRDKLHNRFGVDFKEIGVGGLKMVEELLGYETVIIVDSYVSDDGMPGRIRESTPDQFEDTLHVSSPHGTNFAMALQLYRSLQPERVPRRIRIFTIDIDPNIVFGESMTGPVQESASKLVESIFREIEQTLNLEATTADW